jgi:Anp1/Glycosyl transferase family 2
MKSYEMDANTPLVSVILTTRDRPRLLSMALACYQHQTYARRELVVVDDGIVFPAEAALVEAVGGRLIRVDNGTPLGAKLNRGVSEARGDLCQKMDDDDWYAPLFLETMVSALLARSGAVCTPALAFLMPFLFFDVERWEVRRSFDNNLPGATLLFAREDWQERPFRALQQGEDVWFLLDQVRSGLSACPVHGLETYLAVRHAGQVADRGHAWTRQWNGQLLEVHLLERPLYTKNPEALLPPWALAFYRDLQRDLLTAVLPQNNAGGDAITARRWDRKQSTSARIFQPLQAVKRSHVHTGARTAGDKVLILTPVKDAADCIDGYCEQLCALTYPHALISLGFLESDSTDMTFEVLQRRMRVLRRTFRRVDVWKKDFGYRIPPGIHRSAPVLQRERRAVLARSRNHLLFHALDDEAWVLWLDVDVIEYPPDILERLLSTGRDIVQPHCVLDYGGPTFDRNGWRDQGHLHLDDLRGDGDLVELDAVGGAVLLVRADLHRDGLIYPAFHYGQGNPRIRADNGFEGYGEIESEGLGIMAADMGYQCWGMPHLEVIHRRH